MKLLNYKDNECINIFLILYYIQGRTGPSGIRTNPIWHLSEFSFDRLFMLNPKMRGMRMFVFIILMLFETY